MQYQSKTPTCIGCRVSGGKLVRVLSLADTPPYVMCIPPTLSKSGKTDMEYGTYISDREVPYLVGHKIGKDKDTMHGIRSICA
jgi:hypothetical protein